MTRTARRNTKKEPLPATPWEELSGEQSNLWRSESSEEKPDLRLTRERKLGPKVSKRAKAKLKRLTRRAPLKRTLSDTIKLVEPSFENAHASGSETQCVASNHVRTKKKKMRGDSKGITGTLETSKRTMARGKNRSKLNLKHVHRKKRKRVSADRVRLLRQSDSDSSLSDQAEVVSGGESGSETVEPTEDREMDEQEEEEEKRLKSTSKGRRASGRVRIGNRWVKANTRPPAKDSGDGEMEQEGQEERKRKRPMDEESRRKRIEHRKLRRQRKKVCFNCRQPGHWVGDCPHAPSSAGICFKCGSSEHSCQQCRTKVPAGEFPYARCFICGEMGHLTRSCPDNPRGLYPRGGGCKICGSVEHLKANCPKGKTTATKTTTTSSGRGEHGFTASADALEETEMPVRKKPKTRTREKVVKF